MSNVIINPFRSFGGQPFAPSQLSDLAYWLDADDASTITLNGSDVSAWGDKASSDDAVQATASKQPAYVEGALNGRPVVRFSGSEVLRTPAFSPVYAQPYTIFAVVANVGTSGTWLGAFDGRTSGTRVYFYRTPDDVMGFSAGTRIETSGMADGVYTMVGNGASSVVRHNGSEEVSGDAGSGDLEGFNIGSRYTEEAEFFIGDWAELVVYHRLLTNEERGQVESYLMSKWGMGA